MQTVRLLYFEIFVVLTVRVSQKKGMMVIQDSKATKELISFIIEVGRIFLQGICTAFVLRIHMYMWKLLGL